MAVVEDAADFGRHIDRAMEDRLHRLARERIGLPRPISRTLSREFDYDLGRVRLHIGHEVDAVARELNASAFCVEESIFLASSALQRGHSAILDTLRHELTHVAVNPTCHRIRCWDHDIHSKLTQAACRAFHPALERLLKDNQRVDVTGGVEGLIKGLMNASSNMDVRNRVSNVKYWGDLLFKSLPTKLGLRNVIAGEGPAHGEGLDYSSRDWQANIAKNEDEQNRHIDLAIKEFRKDQSSWLDDVLPEIRRGSIPVLGPITLLEKEWIKSLANALHVAQDRAAHREGVQGYGHDDGRCRTRNWNPDVPQHDHPAHDAEGRTWKRCSAAAYNKSLNNSYAVMSKFLSGIGIQVVTPSTEPVECSSGSEYRSQAAWDTSPPVTTSSDTDPKAARGRTPGSIGLRGNQSTGARLPGPLGRRPV